MRRLDVPILVVGAGPAGLTAGLLLARAGLRCRVVERRAGPQRAPAAHVVNARTFEIWRQAGADMGAIMTAAQDPADAGAVYWVTRLGGEVLGRLPFERQGDDVLALTPTPLRNLSQHRLEPILADELGRVGAGALRYGQTWESTEADAGGLVSRVRDAATGDVDEIRSRYLLAADGAGSPIRRSLGIAPVGPERLQSFVMIHFAASLRALVRDCPGVLYWICDPDAGGALVAHDIDREWVYMHAFDPERESRDDYTAAVCEALVRRTLAGDAADVPLEIRTVSTWTMTAQVAERYRAGRIFLAGDAAHRFPPTGGLGLNTGVQDVHNLVWKLAAVEAGWAHPALLDTYEIERRPVAQRNAEQSLENALRLLEVPQALGVSPDPAASRAAMRAVLADPEGRARVAAAIARQAEHFDMLGAQLGYRYEAGAVVAEDAPPSDRAAEDATFRATEGPTSCEGAGGRDAGERGAENSTRDFVPTSRPGARLPHGWVDHGDRRVSTLDLVAPDGLTLIAGPAGAAWIEAARGARVPLRALQIGAAVVDRDGWWSSVAAMGPGGALLIRPDQHVAFRARHGVADAWAALAAAIARTCGWPGR